MLAQLQQRNPHIQILSTSDPSFRDYAMPVEPDGLKGLVRQLEQTTDIPAAGNIYVASDERLESGEEFRRLKDGYYGGMPIQIGYCNGRNQFLNALEYHRGCEVTLAASDLVLLLAHFNDIKGGLLDSSMIKAYYIAKGEAFALYESTLHFSPCAVQASGFKAGIVLPRGTNTPYSLNGEPVFWQDKLVFARNKWLIAHPDSVQAREKGAYAGIVGENIKINTIDG